MRVALVLMVLISSACRTASHSGPAPRATLRIEFSPQSDSFAAAARDYAALWTAEGERIVRVMQSIAGLSFDDTLVHAVVFERASYSGYRDAPMHLRASYPADTKKATLIHELGHRLQADLFRQGEDDHKSLFLWIYDVWVALYGQEFADAQVVVERARRGVYPAAWDWALSFDRAGRAREWAAIRAARSGGGALQ